MLITTGAPQENNNPYNFLDTKTIYDYFMEHYETQTVLENGQELLTLNTRYAKEAQLSFKSQFNLSKYLPKNYAKENIKIEYLGIQEVNYDTPINTKLGTLKIIVEGETLKTLDIILNETLHFDIFKYLTANIHWVIIVILVILSFYLYFHFLKKTWKQKRKNQSRTVKV